MIFTGKNLQQLQRAFAHAISDCQMQIGMLMGGGPLADDDIDELEAEKAEFQRTLNRIDRAIEREANKHAGVATS